MHNYSQKEKNIFKFQQINYGKQTIKIILALKKYNNVQYFSVIGMYYAQLLNLKIDRTRKSFFTEKMTV